MFIILLLYLVSIAMADDTQVEAVNQSISQSIGALVKQKQQLLVYSFKDSFYGTKVKSVAGILRPALLDEIQQFFPTTI